MRSVYGLLCTGRKWEEGEEVEVMFPPAEEHPRRAATLSCGVDPQEELASGTGTVLMDESFATEAQETNEGAQKRN